MEYSVTYSTKTISAELDAKKVQTTDFKISGKAYIEDSNEKYGNYIILDEIDCPGSGLSQFYSDPQDDVIRSYTLINTVTDKPGVDIISIQLLDTTTELIKIKTTFNGDIATSQNILYKFELGNTIIEYSSGIGTIQYPNSAKMKVTIQTTINTISVDLARAKLVFKDKNLKINTRDLVSDQKLYYDEYVGLLPEYLVARGAVLNMDIIMFKEDKMRMTLTGTLNLTNTIMLRYFIDEDGNNNDEVEPSEVDSLVNSIHKFLTAEDLFEFKPYVDSVPGMGKYDITFENLTGQVNAFKSASISITSDWEFIFADVLEHQIKLKTLDTSSTEELAFVLEYIISGITISISEEFKYWEIEPNSQYPPKLADFINPENNSIYFHEMKYYEFEFGLAAPKEFGFKITYNETLADQDKNKKKKDGSDGFLPGFEMLSLIVGLGLLVILIRRKNN